MTATGGLEDLGVAELLDRLHDGSTAALKAVRDASPDIERAVDELVSAWRAGGRLVYVGAGTSGRIGLLDAAECRPTFGVPPDRVLAVLAGGAEALGTAVEGAEDDESTARIRVDALEIGPNDLVVGISASGETPFTCAALERARDAGARTVAFTGDPGSRLARAVALAVVLAVGDEVVLGSTRLAAGTAQKLACNALTTAGFARLGRVRGREMVAVRPTNRKLRRRAVDILVQQLGTDPGRADELLEAAGGDLPCALVMGATGLSRADAATCLEGAGGDIPRALAAAESRR